MQHFSDRCLGASKNSLRSFPGLLQPDDRSPDEPLLIGTGDVRLNHCQGAASSTHG
jgi:hypothetical protein